MGGWCSDGVLVMKLLSQELGGRKGKKLGRKTIESPLRDGPMEVGESQGLSRDALRRQDLVYERSLLLPSVISQCIQVKLTGQVKLKGS